MPLAKRRQRHGSVRLAAECARYGPCREGPRSDGAAAAAGALNYVTHHVQMEATATATATADGKAFTGKVFISTPEDTGPHEL